MRILALDSLGRVELDTSTGILVGRDTGQVRIIAHVGNLQSEPITVTVVQPPTAIIPLDPLVDTLNFTIDFTTGRDTLQNLRVRLVHVTGTDTALSFFSGHASETAALSATATYLAFARSSGTARPWITLVAGTLLTTFVSYERVNAGKHFPTDVIAGLLAFLTLAWLLPEDPGAR